MATVASVNSSETTPLIATNERRPSKPVKNVTFSPNTTINTIDATDSRPKSSSNQHVLSSNVNGPLSSLNSKLRRRNSYGSPLVPPHNLPISKIGPQRTTKNAQKLKLLPNPEFGEDGPDEESGRDVYSQYTRIKDPTARRDAARLGKADRDRLPRVTAYCTSNKYQMNEVMRFLKGRGKTKGANPKLFDECIYTPYSYTPKVNSTSDRATVKSSPMPMWERRHSDSAIEVEDNNKQRRDELIDLHTEAGDITISNGESGVGNSMQPETIIRRMEDENVITENTTDFDTQVHTPEVFLFDYGVVVIWGMSLQHEQRFLKEIAKFESEKLAINDVETECFNFYYTREYQARIYNDFITLREKNNYMMKLAISHALAQSVKVFCPRRPLENTAS